MKIICVLDLRNRWLFDVQGDSDFGLRLSRRFAQGAQSI
jgi:hypothetical protein